MRGYFRSYRSTPGLVALTVLVLALGIGATVAIFSVVNEALIRPLLGPPAGQAGDRATKAFPAIVLTGRSSCAP